MSHSRHGECDIDPQRTDETSGSEQPACGSYDAGPGRYADGCQRTAYQAHLGGLPGTRRSRPSPRSSGPQGLQRDARACCNCCGSLARTKYAEANHTHLSELLSEREGIDIGRSTLRRILITAGLSSPRQRRPPKHRVRRQRMPREGMLIQMDGSHHPWLGDQILPFTLLIAVDDATGTVVEALFCQQEDAHNYFLLMQALMERCGRPVALYTDRHGVFKHTPGSGLPGMPTQFSRAMEELGIQMIFALSPQGKGRVERAAGTFQDRLVTELRLAGASCILEANRVLKQFLPRFNRRFGVPPLYPEPAFRPLDPELCLEQVLCFKHRRKVARATSPRCCSSLSASIASLVPADTTRPGSSPSTAACRISRIIGWSYCRSRRARSCSPAHKSSGTWIEKRRILVGVF